jgi:hypothetical protein
MTETSSCKSMVASSRMLMYSRGRARALPEPMDGRHPPADQLLCRISASRGIIASVNERMCSVSLCKDPLIQLQKGLFLAFPVEDIQY